MQAKDIPELPILRFLALRSPLPSTWFDNDGELFENSVQHGMPAGIHKKLALAKMRAMVSKWLAYGCCCGCRGDFVISDKGLRVIEDADLEIEFADAAKQVTR